VIDQQPSELSHIQQQMLFALAKQVIQLLEFDASDLDKCLLEMTMPWRHF